MSIPSTEGEAEGSRCTDSNMAALSALDLICVMKSVRRGLMSETNNDNML